MRYLIIILLLLFGFSIEAQTNRTSLKRGIQKCLDGLGDPIENCFVVTDVNGEQKYVDNAYVLNALGITSGDVTDFTEASQDAVGAMVNSSLTYTDATPLLEINLGNSNTWTTDQTVPAEAYGVGWDGSNEVPTKNDLYDKIETVGGATDHGALTGLSDDDHTQYALLAGRATGQTLNGGNAANEDLTLNGTSHATKTSSYVLLQPTGGNVGIGTTAPAGVLEIWDPVNAHSTMLVGSNGRVQLKNNIGGGTRFLDFDSYAGGSVINFAAGNDLDIQQNGTTRFIIKNSTGRIGIGTSSPDQLLHAELADALTNTVSYPLRLSHITSGTATTSFGIGQEYELENASGTNRVAATHEITWSDATDATEDATYTLKLMRAGTLGTAMTVGSTGVVTLENSLTTLVGSITSAGNMTIIGTGKYLWTGRARMQSPSDGVLELTNSAETDFNRLQFGGTTSSFPSLKRSGTGIVVRLADDSANAPLTASTGTFTGPVTLPGYTVATLPAGVIGMTAYVTDATAPTYLGALVGGGAVVTPVFYNGTAWVSY